MRKRKVTPNLSRANRALLKQNLAVTARRRAVTSRRVRAIKAVREFADEVRAFLREEATRLPELYGPNAREKFAAEHLARTGQQWPLNESAANCVVDVDEIETEILKRINQCFPESITDDLSDREQAALIHRQHISAEDLREELGTTAEALRVARHRAKRKVAGKIPASFRWQQEPGRAKSVTRVSRRSRQNKR